jgi:hypothetical protein
VLPVLVDLVFLRQHIDANLYPSFVGNMALCYPMLRRLYIEHRTNFEVVKFINALPPTMKTLRIGSTSTSLRIIPCLHSALGLSVSDVSSRPSFTLDRILYEHGSPNMSQFRQFAKMEPRFVLLKGIRLRYTTRALHCAAEEEKRNWLDMCAGKRDYWEPADEEIDYESPGDVED